MKKKILVGIIIIVATLCTLTTTHYCDIDTGRFSDIYTGEAESLGKIGGTAVAIAQAVGMSVAVFMLILLGVRYMYASTDDKAKIKERAIPYITGAVILFGASSFLKIIVEQAQKIFNS